MNISKRLEAALHCSQYISRIREKDLRPIGTTDQEGTLFITLCMNSR
jgi:hypothetical protein